MRRTVKSLRRIRELFTARKSALLNFSIKSSPELAERTPLLVFINKRSGGQAGEQLFKQLSTILNPLQAFRPPARPAHSTHACHSDKKR